VRCLPCKPGHRQQTVSGEPRRLSDNCYLIQHGSQLLLWDTGYPDAVADQPTGIGQKHSPEFYD